MRVLLIAMLELVMAGMAQAEVAIDWVTVGDPGNAADDTGYGAVDYVYNIGKYEVTNAQYAEFLNAVAARDPNALYDSYMGDVATMKGGITRSGSPGSYTYSAIAGRENMPVNLVSFFDAARFANWLHNGQPSGVQDSTTTEDGAYDMSTGYYVAREPDARIFVPSEDEWYKGAYYDAISMSYFDYPAGTDIPTTCAAPGATPNTANCNHAVGDLTDVGSYTGSASPNGTFDQGGNAAEWNETLFEIINRGTRGGSLDSPLSALAAAFQADYNPRTQNHNTGFRVAMIPEPGTGLLGMTGLLGLALKRRRAA